MIGTKTKIMEVTILILKINFHSASLLDNYILTYAIRTFVIDLISASNRFISLYLLMKNKTTLFPFSGKLR